MRETLTNCNRQNVEMTECLLTSGSQGSVFNNLSDSQGNSKRLFFIYFQIYTAHFSGAALFVKKA